MNFVFFVHDLKFVAFQVQNVIQMQKVINEIKYTVSNLHFKIIFAL